MSAGTNQIEALRDAASIVDGIAEALADGDLDRLPAQADLRAFADHCRLLADEAYDATFRGEMLGPDASEEA